MKKKFIYHCLFWLCIYLLWVFVFRNYSFSMTKTMTVEFCYLLFITADYYVTVYYIFPHFLKQKKYSYFIVSTVALIAFSALLRSIVSLQINIHFWKTNPPAFLTLYLSSLLNILIWVQLIIYGKLIIDRIYNQQQMALLEKERVKQELDFLKAQINPHALFNSLNTIYGHIEKSNQTARNTLLKFSGLLRYQLYDCSEEKISIEKEIEFLKNYISFQQIRKEENLKVNVDIIIDPGSNYTIAPLLLVVLVENAFKFVSNAIDKENKIEIKLATIDNKFDFYISNTTEQRTSRLSTANQGGIGITNLKRRLELLYPAKYIFDFKQEADGYIVHLNLQLA